MATQQFLPFSLKLGTFTLLDSSASWHLPGVFECVCSIFSPQFAYDVCQGILNLVICEIFWIVAESSEIF